MSSNHMTQPDLTKPPVLYSRDEHTVSRSAIDPDALKIMYRLIRAGYKGYLVGGGVRDLLLGKTPKDFDIATDATPRQIKELFRNSRIIGRRFKLVHVFFGQGKNIQVSTFRDVATTVETDEEAQSPESALLAADNTYGDEVTDAFRRDLTINGLFYDPDTFSIVDYVGGMSDLRAGIIRIIGTPEVRYHEDPVRLIRVVRHAARSGFIIEHETAAAIEKKKMLLNDCPPMRIFEEVKKDLVSGSALPIFKLLAQYGLLQIFLPELTDHNGILLSENSRLAQALAINDTLCKNGEVPSTTVLLALIALFAGATELRREDPILRFTERAQIEEHLRSIFKTLSVPKRDRERIEQILCAWFKLQREGADARIRGLTGSTLGEDIIMLSRLISQELEHEMILHLIHASLSEDTSRGGGERGDGSRRRRYRNNRRGGARGRAPHHRGS
jgi:poly(A) polymerase